MSVRRLKYNLLGNNLKRSLPDYLQTLLGEAAIPDAAGKLRDPAAASNKLKWHGAFSLDVPRFSDVARRLRPSRIPAAANRLVTHIRTPRRA